MEAWIRFYLMREQHTISGDHLRQLDEGWGDSSERWEWLKANGEVIGLPPKAGFVFWDQKQQNFYIRESNGKRVPYGCDGFECPDYLPDPMKFPISSVDAVIYFESIAGVPTGEFEVKREARTVKVALSSKTVDMGVRRFEMRVGTCASVEELSQIAALIRSGAHAPKVAWP